MTQQLDTWRGDFGQAYTDRNQIDWHSRLPGFREVLSGLTLPRVVEVGCNRGHNLIALAELLGESSEIVGIEPNRYARELARQASPKFGVLEGNGSELPFRDGYADLVFTAGVLIHVPPAVLPGVLREIARVSRRYVLALEYFSEQPEEVPYRGLTEHLWKRNFLADYQAVAPELKLVRSGYFGPEQGFDRTTWWLLEK